MHKSYQCIKCYGRVLSIIYSIYKIEDPAFSCWPGKSLVHEEKEAEAPQMLWLTLPIAPGRASIMVLSLSATIYCNCLVACCRAGATQNKSAGCLSKGTWRLGHRVDIRVKRELYSTDRRRVQLPTVCALVPFLVPADILCELGVMEQGTFEDLWFLTWSVGTPHFAATVLNQWPLSELNAFSRGSESR